MRLVDADALDDVVQMLNEKKWGITIGDYKLIDAVLFEFPTIEERKTGKWIAVDDAYNRISGKCSACGWEAHLYEDDVVGMDYCPNCGADMRGEEE